MSNNIICHICILFSVSAFGQQFVPIDTIAKSTPLYQLEIDDQGNRYYSFEQVREWDSVEINGQRYDTQYPLMGFVLALDQSGDSIYTIHPGGNHIQLLDDKLVTFLSFWQDSIIIDTTVFYNNSPDGVNLLIRAHDQTGKIIDSKHWDTNSEAIYTIGESIYKNGMMLIGGDIRLDTILVNDSIEIIGYEDNVFFGMLDAHLDLLWAESITAIGFQHLGEISMDNRGHSVSFAQSNRTRVFTCDDTLVNPSASFPNEFAFIVAADKYGNCLKQKVFISDFGGSASRNVVHFSDNKFVTNVACNFCDRIEMDGISIASELSPNDSYLFLFDTSFTATKGLKIEGSPGRRNISNIIIDNNDDVWMSGSCFCDTLSIGNQSIFKQKSQEYVVFIAKLDSNLDPIFIKELGSRGGRLVLNSDGSRIYIHLSTDDDNQILYEIIDSISAVDNQHRTEKLDIILFPNVLTKGEKLNVAIGDALANTRIKHYEIYRTDGLLASSSEVNVLSDGFNINTTGMSQGMYILVMTLSDGQVVSERFIIY